MDSPFMSRKRPAKQGTILASNQKFIPGQVIVAGNFRYIVIEEISKEEFQRQLEININHPAGYLAGSVEMRGSTANPATERRISEVDFSAKYYYRADASFSKGELYE
jgi:hypothetical protein